MRETKFNVKFKVKESSDILDNHMPIFKGSLLFLSFFGAFSNQGNISFSSRLKT